MRSICSVLVVLLLSSALHAEEAAPSPPSPKWREQKGSPTALRLDDRELTNAQAAGIVLGAIWVAVILEPGHPPNGGFDALWPSASDDLDVDALTALRRRASLVSPRFYDAREFSSVVASCAEHDAPGDVVVYAVATDKGKDAVLEVRATLLLEALAKGRVVPIADPVLTKHVGDSDAIVKEKTKGRVCVPVEHQGNKIVVKKVDLELPPMPPLPVLRYPCRTIEDTVVAAESFVRLFATPTRDTVHALPVPRVHPSVRGFGRSPIDYVIRGYEPLHVWLSTKLADQQLSALEASSSFVRTEEGLLLQGTVSLKSGKKNTWVTMAVYDGTCRLEGVPWIWSPTGKDDWRRTHMYANTPLVTFTKKQGRWIESPAR